MNKDELGRLYPIILARYDADWPQLFEKEKKILIQLLGPGLRIEHIGSTAVIGLSAKPTIDILAERPPEPSDERIIQLMAANGYWHMEEQTKHLMFIKGYGPAGLEKESYHIHMGPLSQNWLWDRVYFRDYLNADQAEAKNYERLKKKLAGENKNDREAYTEKKTEYITRITELAKRGRR